MPYIKPDDRSDFVIYLNDDFSRADIGNIMGSVCRNGGDFQYILAVAINTYLQDKGLNYQNCQDIMGALTGANQEFYRRVVGPYEDIKMVENGSVYDVLPDSNEY